MEDLLSADDISQITRKKANLSPGDLSPTDYIKWITDNSFEGIWTDCNTLPKSLQSDNVLKIVKGHRSLLRYIARQENI